MKSILRKTLAVCVFSAMSMWQSPRAHAFNWWYQCYSPYVFVNGPVNDCEDWYANPDERCEDACNACSMSSWGAVAINCVEASSPEFNDGSVTCLCAFR